MAKSKIANTTLSIIFALISINGFTTGAMAQISFSQNHPELKWEKIESAHFIVIYHNGVEKVATEVSRIAEEIYPQITADIGIAPPRRTPIVVSDYSDFSNGLTTPLGHYIFLWTRAMEKYTTGGEDWLKSLVAHEFTHLVNFYAFRGWGGFWHELVALGFVPTWFLEGVAQLEAEKWCANRDMLLRVVSYHRDLLPYKRMTGFIAADQIDARLVYEQGHSLVRYIVHRFGSDKFREIFQKFRSFPFSFNLALKRAIGMSEKELFRLWESQISKHYSLQFENQTPVSQLGEIVETPFDAVFGARWSPDGNFLALSAVKDLDSHIRELFLLNRETGKIKKIASPFVNAIFSWSRDSRYIVFSQKHVIQTGSQIFDLFLFDINTGKIKRLTNGERANDPDFSPSGDKVVYTKHEATGSNLWTLDLQTGEKKKITNFSPWHEIFSPRWSPDGQKIAFSLLDDRQNRDIYVINADGANLSPLIKSPADDRYPAWSESGEKLAFISYRNGTPNLFLKDIKSGQITQITHSPGGVFLPEWIPRSNKISVIAFEDRDKIPLVTIDLENIQPSQSDPLSPPSFATTPVPVYQRDKFSKLQNFSQTSSAYNALGAVKPQILLPYFDWSEEGWQPGIVIRLADPLEKHAFLIAGTHRTRPHFYFDYMNRQFAPTIEFYLQRSTIDHGDFLFLSDGRKLPLYEDYRIGSLILNWRINLGKNYLSWHDLFFRATFARRQIINKSDYENSEIPDSFQPFQGWTNSYTLRYSFINYRPDVFYDIHPRTGESISISFRQAPRFLGSDLRFNQLSALGIIRREMPFWRHVAALRTGAFLRAGDQAIQSRPALGAAYLRGLKYSREGDLQIFANLEYRFPLIRDLGLKIWILYFEHISAAIFTDIGKAWSNELNEYYGNARHYSDAEWIQTAGLALRHRFYLLGKIPIVIQMNYGVNVKNFDEHGFSVLFGRVF